MHRSYEAWLHTKVDRVSEILQRKQGQMGFEGMPRLQRVLRDILYATGRAIDRHGRHLPLADSLVLLDTQHHRHADVFRRVGPFLAREILSDFEVIHGFRRVEDLRRETESTVNRLRSFLGPIVRGIFSETVNTIDFFSIVQKGEILLVNLRETDYFSGDQANAIGGLFIHEILTTAANTPRELRKQHTLIVDEAGVFIGQDLLNSLGTHRKYKLRIVLGGQDLSTFVKGDIDMRPKILTQPGTVICFQQAYEEDLDILAPRLGRGNLEFEELYQVVDRPDGYELLPMQDYSESFTWAENWSEGGAISSGETTTRTKSIQNSRQETWSHAQSHQEGHGHVETNGRTDGKNSSRGGSDSRNDSLTRPRHDRSHGELDRISTGRAHVDSHQEGETHAEQSSQANSTNVMDGETNTVGGGLTKGEGQADAAGTSLALTRNVGSGGANGGSQSMTQRLQVIQKTREERHPTGKLRHSIVDQFEQMKTDIFCQETGQCIVKIRGVRYSVPVQVALVKEMWHTANKFRQIERLKAELVALRPYFAPLRISNDHQEERLVVYLKPDVPLLTNETDALHVVEPGRTGHVEEANGHANCKPPPKNPFGR